MSKITGFIRQKDLVSRKLKKEEDDDDDEDEKSEQKVLSKVTNGAFMSMEKIFGLF